MAAIVNNAAQIIEAIEALIPAIQAKTGLEIRLGYIGNLERWGDDRSWRIWVQGIYVTGGKYTPRGNTLESPDFETKDLDGLLRYVEEGGIEKTIAWAVSRPDIYGFRNVHDINRTVTQSAWEVEGAARAVADAVTAESVTYTLTYEDETSRYRLGQLADGSHAIYSPDGEGGWYLVEDDAPSDVSGFESRCDLLSEELRILTAEARAEFGS